MSEGYVLFMVRLGQTWSSWSRYKRLHLWNIYFFALCYNSWAALRTSNIEQEMHHALCVSVCVVHVWVCECVCGACVGVWVCVEGGEEASTDYVASCNTIHAHTQKLLWKKYIYQNIKVNAPKTHAQWTSFFIS